MADRLNNRANNRMNSGNLSQSNRLPSCDGSVGGCNQENGSSSNCKNLLHRLQTLDFSIIDTVLYLDAYPDCQQALDYYKKLQSERAMLLSTLSQSCRLPITSFENSSVDNWDWVDGPWPWEPSAN